jgi:hypothetical protein
MPSRLIEKNERMRTGRDRKRGLADFVVAVTAGFLTSPSSFQLFAFDLPNELVSRFPLVLIPVFVVPVSALLHLASLSKLRRGALRDNHRREIAHSPA